MSKVLNEEEVIERFNSVHGNRYDYSEVEYRKMHDKVNIVCPVHGMFQMTPHSHLKGQGCPKCGVESRSIKRMDDNDSFIEKAKKVHGVKYDYSKVKYESSQKKVCIICSKHGEFWQKPNNHLQGRGCPICKKERLMGINNDTLDSFIEKAIKIHGDKYDYSKVEYVNSATEVCIICPKHGEFWQKANSHLQGHGCHECGVDRSHLAMTNEQWIEKAKQVHGNRYDYSKVEYKSPFDYVTITCPKHGDFSQKATYHLCGNGCSKCGIEKVKDDLSLSVDVFLERARQIHGDKYDYSKMEYINNKTPISIICKKHGEFIVRPDNHLYNKSGCPRCSTSKLEECVQMMLKDNGIDFEVQKCFNWLKNDITNYPMRYDIYIPSKNIAIECQGIQHFISGGMFSEDGLKEIIHRDKVKNNLSNENGVKLLYFTESSFKGLIGDLKFYNDGNIFFNLDDLLRRIMLNE